VYGSAESTLTPLMVEVESRYRRLKVFSLPHVGEDGTRRHIELGVRGEPTEVAEAIAMLKSGVAGTGATFSVRPVAQTQKPPGDGGFGLEKRGKAWLRRLSSCRPRWRRRSCSPRRFRWPASRPW
jgi:hypothetical protein